jgi:hypothetical protein
MVAEDSTKCDNIYVYDATGINESTTKDLSAVTAYPNPFFDRVTLSNDMPNGRQGVLSIYDVSGRLIKKLDQPSVRVWDGTDTKGMAVAPGVYFVTIENGNVLTQVVKVH